MCIEQSFRVEMSGKRVAVLHFDGSCERFGLLCCDLGG